MNPQFNEEEAMAVFKKDCLTLGENLTAFRKQRKEGLKKVAKAVKCAPGTLGKLEKGQYERYPVTLLAALSRYYGVRPSLLITKGANLIESDNG